jgi:hypothetical protein
MNKRLSFIFVVVVATLSLLAGCKTQPTTPSTPVVETVIVTATPAPTETSMTTPTLEPTEEIKATEMVIPLPDTPAITGTYGDLIQQGEYLDTVLGKRITFTNRKILVPNKAWNDPLTSEELELVETQWVSFSVSVPEGMWGTVFAGGLKQNTTVYNGGILLTLTPGTYKFQLRNGEIVLWYPKNNSFAAKDLVRIIEQIKVGNFDTKAPLSFFGVTPDLLPSIPDEIIKERNIEIIPFLDPGK